MKLVKQRNLTTSKRDRKLNEPFMRSLKTRIFAATHRDFQQPDDREKEHEISSHSIDSIGKFYSHQPDDREEEHEITFCAPNDPYDDSDSPAAGQHFTPHPPNLPEIRTHNFVQANFHGLHLGREGDGNNTQDEMIAHKDLYLANTTRRIDASM
jgi:hypothetical protein